MWFPKSEHAGNLLSRKFAVLGLAARRITSAFDKVRLIWRGDFLFLRQAICLKRRCYRFFLRLNMSSTLTQGEEAQLSQTIEMFEVITQSQPHDYQSLEILKEAYHKLGRQKDLVNTSKRIAKAHVELGHVKEFRVCT